MLAQRRRKGARTARPTSLVTADKSRLLRIGDARVIAGLSRDEPSRLPNDIDRARYGTVRKDAPDTSDKCLVLSPDTLFPFSFRLPTAKRAPPPHQRCLPFGWESEQLRTLGFDGLLRDLPEVKETGLCRCTPTAGRRSDRC